MHLTKIASLITRNFHATWERERSVDELRSFVDGLHGHVQDVELEVSF